MSIDSMRGITLTFNPLASVEREQGEEGRGFSTSPNLSFASKDLCKIKTETVHKQPHSSVMRVRYCC